MHQLTLKKYAHAFPSMLLFGRLVRQAAMIDLNEQNEQDRPTELKRKIKIHMDPTVGLHLDDVLKGGSALYRAAVDVMHQLSDALGIEEQQFQADKVDLFDKIQNDIVHRIKFMEAVALRYDLDSVYSDRSDTRLAVLKRATDLLQRDLDYLVAGLYKHEIQTK